MFSRISKTLMFCLVICWGICVSSYAPISNCHAQSTPQFLDQRAMELLVQQCEMGPRIPGSDGNRQLREDIIAAARKLGLVAQTHCFFDLDQRSGEPLELCNIIVSAGPKGGSRLWLGAHYDSRPECDLDPDPAKRSLPLPAANDGASGVAVLWHLMEILAQHPPETGVDLLFFDGEDAGISGQPRSYCRGSARLAAECRDFGNPLANGDPRAVVVIDMIGKKNLAIPREAYSNQFAPEWTAEVFNRAFVLGLSAFMDHEGQAVFDDHVPFLEAGIPAVDLIDFDFPQWHTSADTPEVCSAASLGQVGTLLLDLIYNP